MPVMTSTVPRSDHRLLQALVIAASLLLVLTMAALVLGVVAIEQRAVPLPAFSVRIGHVQFGAPCPSPAFECDVVTNYYAIWRGDDQPDGTIQFHEIFFTYLPHKNRR